MCTLVFVDVGKMLDASGFEVQRGELDECVMRHP